MQRYALIVAAALALSACHGGIQPPGDAGVCYHLAQITDGKPKFNVVAAKVPDMEHCAAQLEAMRTRFLALGGTTTDIVGAYQGNFLFLGPEGVFTGDSYEGPRYPFMVRSGDQLVPVGSGQ
ncbi:MAG TPA: hypothetical protein VHX64_10450 [Caulobacteraceae bacterium]|jgi:hypothetical protein|nr:hypothetical protein [Caulobacteraceae bacterium]HEX4097140.1 hypothetical protein [Caulobacteraceae bacterium]